MHASKKNLCNNVLKDLMKTARKDNKTVWKIHTFVWKKKTLVIDRLELLLGRA